MLAGDYLKEASDCNVNMLGVGLLYRYGYFQQQISAYGEQVNLYPPQSFSKLPIKPYKDEDGNWIMVSVAMPGRNLYARIWRVDVGRIPLYLLDTDFDKNWQEDRGVTATLYGGDVENRLKQEILLGIGGVRMLKAIGETPTIFHLNEGHAAFLNLERILQVMQEEHLNRQMAVELVKASSLYTTHTPVPAGHDAFTEDLMRAYFATYSQQFNVSWEAFMGYGRRHDSDTFDKFSMSILACRFSQEINGVSRIHGRVSQEMFADLYEGRFAEESHIGYVTNGVHYPTWAHKKWQTLHRRVFGEEFGKDCSNPVIWSKIESVPEADIWKIKQDLRKEMMTAIKEMLSEQMRTRNESPALIEATIKALRDDVLTIGFARRFATYKRATLLFSNLDRLNDIVNNPQHPVQFLFAGKAHPADRAGQDLIKRIIDISKMPQFLGKIVFVPNYDITIAKLLVQGVDVWMNNPTRPQEASGTSGEKAVMNGVMHFSVLDGWWVEGYKPGAGWALKMERTYDNQAFQDDLDSSTIYNILETEIVPTFYDKDEQGLSKDWIGIIKNTVAKVACNFTTNRMLSDYCKQYYEPLCARCHGLVEDDFSVAREIAFIKKRLRREWGRIEVLSFQRPAVSQSSIQLGQSYKSELVLSIGELDPEDVGAEILLTERNAKGEHHIVSIHDFKLVSFEDGVATYRADIVPEVSGTFETASRIFAKYPQMPHRQDLELVKWL